MKPVRLPLELQQVWQLQEFCTSLFRLALSTQIRTTRSVELFAIYCANHAEVFSPEEVTKKHVQGFIHDMYERGLTAQTRNCWVVEIKRYVKWCERTTNLGGGGGL